MRQLAASLLTPDLPFAQEDANRYLPWIIAIMSCLTVFLAGAGITLNTIFIEQHREFEYRMQIQVPYDNGGQDTTARAIVAKLQNMEGVRSAHITPDSELKKILNPWFGQEDFLDLLPVPSVIEVVMDEEAYNKGEISPASLRNRLIGNYPEIVIDDYREWIDDLNAITSGLRHAAYLVSLLILGAATAVVILITRASVQIHYPIVRLLHRMGAADSYITRQFQLNASLLTFKGAAIGTIVGATLYTLSMSLLSAFELPILPDTMITLTHIGFFLALPFIMSAGVAFSTFLSVQFMLRRIY